MSNLPPASPARMPSPLLTGALCRCPRCGKGAMFAGFLTLATRCSVCGLDFAFADTGDGPSFFASFIGGFLLLGVGVTLQVAYDPATWVYVLLVIVGAVLIVGSIRPIKGTLVALQYTNKAEQGRFE